MKKAKQPILYILCAVSSFLLEYLVFFLLEYLFGKTLDEFYEKVIARAISSFFNFNMNHRIVFHGDETYGKSLVKYYCLAIPVMLLSSTLLELVANWTRIDQITADYGRVESAALHTLINAPVDILIAVANFLIQKKWVFSKRKKS